MKNNGRRYTVRKHTMFDFMIYDRVKGYCFGSFGLRSQAQSEVDRLNEQGQM